MSVQVRELGSKCSGKQSRKSTVDQSAQNTFREVFGYFVFLTLIEGAEWGAELCWNKEYVSRLAGSEIL